MDVREGLKPPAFIDAVVRDYNRSNAAPFEIVYSYYRQSLYADSLIRYRKHFGEDLLVLKYDDLLADIAAVLERIVSFLELPPFAFDTNVKHNPAAKPRGGLTRALFHNMFLRRAIALTAPTAVKSKLRSMILVPDSEREPLSKEAVTRLAPLFREDIQRTSELTQMDLSDWL